MLRIGLRLRAAAYAAAACLLLGACSGGTAPAGPAPTVGDSGGEATLGSSQRVPIPGGCCDDSLSIHLPQETLGASFDEAHPVILLDSRDASVLDLHTGSLSDVHFYYLTEAGSAVYRVEIAYKRDGEYIQDQNLFHYYYNFDTRQVSLRLTMDELTGLQAENLYEALEAHRTLTFGLRFGVRFRGEELTTDYMDVQVDVLPFLLNTDALEGKPTTTLFTRAQEQRGSLPLTLAEEAPAMQLTGMFLPDLPVKRFAYTVNGKPDDGLFTLQSRAGGIEIAFNRPLGEVAPGSYRIEATMVFQTPSGNEATGRFTHIVTVEEYLEQRIPEQKELILVDEDGAVPETLTAGRSYELRASLTLADGRQIQLPLSSVASLRIRDPNGNLVAVEEWSEFEGRRTERYEIYRTNGRIYFTPMAAGRYQLHGSFLSDEVNPLDQNIGGIFQVN